MSRPTIFDHAVLLLQLAWVLIRIPFYALWNILSDLFPGLAHEKDVSKDIVLVTGGASGIGALMAKKFGRLGAKIIIWDLNESLLKKVEQEVKTESNTDCRSFVVDVTDRAAVYKCAERIKKEIGDVTILINNAGIVTGKKILDCPDEAMERTMKVNAISHFWTVKAFLQDMLDKNHGHIVTIASNAGCVGIAGLADYCASKFAAVGFDESLRMEFKKLKKTGLKTTCVCPYFIDTGMFDGAATKWPIILPILKPDYVAEQIVHAVRINKAVLMMPRFSLLSHLFRALLPVQLFDEAVELTGASDSMDDFKGRSKSN